MLNRKLVEKGLFTCVTLLYFSFTLMAGTGTQRPDSTKPLTDTAAQKLMFDSRQLQLTGLTESEGFRAPALPFNKHSQKFVKEYLAVHSKKLQKIREKSPAYFAVIDTVFTRYDLPLELKYLSVIESELNTSALSRVGARGLWQLMPTTARLLSLKVNGNRDERTHLYKSTVAAAKYLNDLHDIFGDWLLVIAAYNCGPGPVFKAIRKSGSRNFWVLQQYLPGETRKHVKKFIGTHYFFEGEGSVTTLTKAEATEYSRQMTDFVAKHNMLLQTKKSDTDLPKEEKQIAVRTNVDMSLNNEQEQQAAKGIVE